MYHAPWSVPMDTHFRRMENWYLEFSEWRSKPYLLAEWGLRPPPEAGSEDTTTSDGAAFINWVLEWANAHPRAKALVYWSVNSPSEVDYRARNFPNRPRR